MGIAVWITGLPGSGKSTVSDALKSLCPGLIILRMDELRAVITPHPTYSADERELVYRSLVYLAERLTAAGHDVIIDATGNRRAWRELARSRIPGFVEVYLRCPLEVCMERERKRTVTHGAPKGIYEKGELGWPVPGTGAPYEEPLSPDLIVETDRVTAKEAAAMIMSLLNARIEGS